MNKLFEVLLVIVGLFIFNTQIIVAQQKTIDNIDDANRLLDNIMNAFEEGESKEGFKMLEENISNKQVDFEQLQANFEGFLGNADEQYGKMLGTDFAKEEKVGDFLVRYTYAMKYAEQPVWVRFTYYINDDSYVLKELDWGEDLNTLF